MTRNLRRTVGAAVAVGMVLVTAACGGSDEPKTSENGVTTLKIGVLPTADQGAFFYASKAGIFKKYGLNVEAQVLTAAPALSAALSSGKVDLISTSVPTLAQSIEQGLPFKAVMLHSQMPKTGYMEVLAKKDSGIDDFGDLVGKQVGIVAAQGVFELETRVAVAADGGDDNAVKWVGIPPANNLASIDSGRLTAAAVNEPWLSGALASGKYTSLGSPVANLDFTIPSAIVVSTTKKLKENPEAFVKYREALTEASKAVTADPSLARTAIAANSEMPADLVQKISLPDYTTTIDRDSIGRIIAEMKKFGWVKSVTVDDIVWDGK